MVVVVGFNDIVRPPIGGSANLQAFSLSIFWRKNSMTECKNSSPYEVTLSASHLSRFKYSRRDARAATSSAKVNGRTSNNESRI